VQRERGKNKDKEKEKAIGDKVNYIYCNSNGVQSRRMQRFLGYRPFPRSLLSFVLLFFWGNSFREIAPHFILAYFQLVPLKYVAK